MAFHLGLDFINRAWRNVAFARPPSDFSTAPRPAIHDASARHRLLRGPATGAAHVGFRGIGVDPQLGRPPDPIQNSAVKVLCADGTEAFSGKVATGFPTENAYYLIYSRLGRVGRCQVCQERNASHLLITIFIQKSPAGSLPRGFLHVSVAPTRHAW
jgi:hypothetical protein